MRHVLVGRSAMKSMLICTAVVGIVSSGFPIALFVAASPSDFAPGFMDRVLVASSVGSGVVVLLGAVIALVTRGVLPMFLSLSALIDAFLANMLWGYGLYLVYMGVSGMVVICAVMTAISCWPKPPR